ncbi:hypothetical protein E4Z66_04420 [Aliishimia ponticola]|uniref:Ferrochelatase n=1 Tax=Aliishimia ponticola TaxID=2499833 RepID=A0A4S4NJ83_9RHOB|nr:hypothetical protein [Aliishimia ponticola]THH38807.1 hypothetical protein E4Z66_04420 [Aliishimia ponticola]
MKKSIFLGVVGFALMGTMAVAGSVADPVIEAPVVVEAATSSSSGEVLVLMLALLMILPVVD